MIANAISDSGKESNPQHRSGRGRDERNNNGPMTSAMTEGIGPARPDISRRDRDASKSSLAELAVSALPAADRE